MKAAPLALLKRFAALAMLAAAASAPAQTSAPLKLKLSSFEPPMANITSNVLLPLTRDISAASGNTLQIDVFAGGTLGRNPAQQLKLVTDGIADMAWIVLPYTPGRFDDAEVIGQPFLIRNATEGSLALNRLYLAGKLSGFDGLKMLAVAATPPVTIHGSHSVRQPTDLQGRRVRISGDLLTRVTEALGGAPVQIPGGQIADALSRGVVDMSFNNWGFVGDFKVDQVTTQHLNIPLGAVAVGVVMRQDRYDALPAPARAAIDRFSGEALARKLGVAFDRQEREVHERVAASGRNTVATPTQEELAAWRQAIEPVNLAWRQASPDHERVHAAFVQELEKIRATTPQ